MIVSNTNPEKYMSRENTKKETGKPSVCYSVNRSGYDPKLRVYLMLRHMSTMIPNKTLVTQIAIVKNKVQGTSTV